MFAQHPEASTAESFARLGGLVVGTKMTIEKQLSLAGEELDTARNEFTRLQSRPAR